MPVFTFKCIKCGKEFDLFANRTWFDEADITSDCCGVPAERIISVPAIHFKGAGWTQKSR